MKKDRYMYMYMLLLKTKKVDICTVSEANSRTTIEMIEFMF